MSAGLRRDEGAVAIVVAVVLVVLMAAVALTVDVGGLYLRRRELVNGADSAALSAARTCARGGDDDRFDTPEGAADTAVQANGAITADEVSGINITDVPSVCGAQWGHVSVSYTSEQALYFSPVIGFDHESPVTTAATASWGLGSNNPLPIVVTSLLSDSCDIPPTGSPAVGDTCSFWYDNDRLNGGNFAFLSLNAEGWNVPADWNCAGSGSGGTSRLTSWINGSLPASVVLNWTDPTYVCTDTGIRGVGGETSNSQLWGAVEDLIGVTRDFPINWEGPGSPIPTAPSQGTIYRNSQIDKYDIIGFASMTIVDVLNQQEASGGVGTCSTRQNTPHLWNTVGQVLDLDTISTASPGWQGCPQRIPPDSISDPVVTKAKNNDPDCCINGIDYTYDSFTHELTWVGPVPKETKITFSWTLDPNNGPCGPVPANSSAMCIRAVWQGSTLDEGFPPGTDNNTVVRLCDLGFGTCLDQ